MKKLLGLLSISALFLSVGCASNLENTQEEKTPATLKLEAATYPPSIEDKYSVRLQVFVKNTNTIPISVQCEITPLDSSGSRVAEPMIATTEFPLAPGERDLLTADIPISNGKANSVFENQASCNPVESAAMNWPLVVSKVKNCSFYDEETKNWIWYACFNIAEVEPMTKVECKVLAISKVDYPVLAFSFTGNVLMDNSVIPFGTEMPTGPEALVEAINSFDIKCK